MDYFKDKRTERKKKKTDSNCKQRWNLHETACSFLSAIQYMIHFNNRYFSIMK